MKFDSFIVAKNGKYNLIFFIVISIITLILGIGMANLQTNNDVTVLLPVNEEINFERSKIAQLAKEFPSGEIYFIAIGDNPFTTEKIKALWELCNELDKLDVISTSLHPFNSTYFTKVGPVFSIARMNPRNYPKTDEQISEFVSKLTSNRYLIGSVISYDYKSAGIVVKMNSNATKGKDIENPNIFVKFFQKAFGRSFGKQKIERVDFSEKIQNVLEKYDDKLKIYYAGIPVYESKTKSYMMKDIFMLLGPAIFLMILSLFLSFRTKRGTLLPMLAMVLSVIWTMGLLGWLRIKMNLVSILMPPLILTIGSSYTLHYLNSYYHHSSRFTDRRELILASTRDIFPTIMMASLTTIVGFVSFMTASIGVIREFGFFIIISIFFVLILTFFLLSKMLAMYDIPHNAKVEDVRNDIFGKILKKLNDLVYPLRYFFVLVFIFGIILFALVIPKLKVVTDAAGFFKGEDIVKQSLIFVTDNFGGSTSYYITLRSIDNKRNFFKTKEGMLSAKKVQDYLDKNVIIDGHKMIGWNLSPVTMLQDLNKVMTGELGIPDDESEIKRFFSFLKASGNDDVKSLINSDFSAITFQVRCLTDNEKENNQMSEQELMKLSEKLRLDLGEIAKDDGKFIVDVWGESILLSRISKYLIKDQVMNLVSTLIFVLIIVLILFRSIYYSLVSIIPLTFGVLMNFAIMSIFKIPLDAGTVMIGAIAVGVGIDNSIHFILNFRKRLGNGKTTRDVISETLLYTSRPMAFSSLALILGFSVFFLSSFKPVLYFGVLIAISMFNCIFATLFILPSVLLVTEKIRLFVHSDKKKVKK